MKTKKKKMPYKQLENAASHLGSCVLWALKFLKTSSGGMMIKEGGKRIPWQDDFMDALDKVGYVIDRDKFWEMKSKKGKSR